MLCVQKDNRTHFGYNRVVTQYIIQPTTTSKVPGKIYSTFQNVTLGGHVRGNLIKENLQLHWIIDTVLSVFIYSTIFAWAELFTQVTAQYIYFKLPKSSCFPLFVIVNQTFLLWIIKQTLQHYLHQEQPYHYLFIILFHEHSQCKQERIYVCQYMFVLSVKIKTIINVMYYNALIE